MEFATLLQELGTDIGIANLSLDTDGQCALLFDGEHEVTFTPDREDHSLLMHCEVGRLSAQDSDTCRKLMQASLLGAETGGSALSVHCGLDKIILWKRYDEDFVDLAALEQAINAFLAQVIHWKERLAIQGTSDVTPSGMETLSQRDVMNNLGMFV